jgi:membrane-bound serine protease (ClpP class)
MVPGILGFLCIMIALVYTMSGWEVAAPAGGAEEAPSGWNFDLTTYATGLRHFATGLLGAAALLLILFRFLPESRPFQKLVLATSAGGAASDTPAAQAAQAVRAGDTGIAISALRPAGTAEFDGRRVEVTADQGYLPNGTAVRVREIQGTRIVVEAVA